MRRIFFLLAALLALTACAGKSVWAPDEDVARYRYSSSNSATITLFTVINVNSGNGGHSALMVDAPSERVLFDPAGSFHHPRLPERNDVIHGMKPAAVDLYINYHSRISWRVVKQDLVVPAAVAEQARRLVENNGAVGSAFCANSISTILRQLPGFENIKVTMFPVNLMEQFAQYQGITRSEYHDNDPDINGEILARGI